jgi:DNA-binding CsgD family transcriptional regulator
MRDKVIAALIDQMDAPRFEQAFLEAVDGLVSFDMGMIATYDRNRLASCYAYRFPVGDAVVGFQRFREFTFRYNPFYHAHLGGLDSGVYLMEQLLKSRLKQRPQPEADQVQIDDREEIGYITPGWPRRLREMDFVVRTGPTQTTQIAFYRMDDSRFNGQDVANLRAIQLSLGAVIRRGFATDKNDTQTDSVEAVLAAHALSMREADVMRSVLAGRSAEEIAETFGVSVETIKTQRKRAYAKLGVSSKTELFAKLLSGRALAKAG